MWETGLHSSGGVDLPDWQNVSHRIAAMMTENLSSAICFFDGANLDSFLGSNSLTRDKRFCK